jgi:hypothetical protein
MENLKEIERRKVASFLGYEAIRSVQAGPVKDHGIIIDARDAREHHEPVVIIFRLHRRAENGQDWHDVHKEMYCGGELYQAAYFESKLYELDADGAVRMEIPVYNWTLDLYPPGHPKRQLPVS